MADRESHKRTRKSYTREQKLDVLRWHFSLNGQNLYHTCQQFSLNTKTVLWWVKDEVKDWNMIYNSKKGRKRVQFQRAAEHPDMFMFDEIPHHT